MLSGATVFFLFASIFWAPVISDTVAQVDLIFPRNNTVYRAQEVRPFPIVFAVHNFSAAWKFRPYLNWKLKTIDPSTGDRKALSEDGTIGWDSQTQQSWNPPPDTFVAVNSSVYPSRLPGTLWELEYLFFMGTLECDRSYRTQHKGKIRFSTSMTEGIQPDLSTDRSCAPSIGAIGVQNFDSSNGTCILMSSPQPSPISCAISVDIPTAGQILKVMNQGRSQNFSCQQTKSSWPNMTILGGGSGYDDCPLKSAGMRKSSQNISGAIATLLLVAAAMWN